MAEVFFDNPPILNGTEKDQLLTLQRYLNTMSDKLNQALMTITIEQMAPEAQQTIKTAAGSKADAEKQYNGLKSMIVKTAEIVRNEMDEISTELNAHYDALSEQFGSYEQNLQQTIIATATGVVQNFNYDETIQNLQDSTEAFQKNISAYIFSGLVDPVNGKYGIAIGQNVTDETTGDYVEANKMATFTSDKLSFWQNGVEVAYFSDNTYYIANGVVTGSLMMGNHTWKIMADGSLGLISG